MYREPIFLQPVFQERLWGGVKLKTLFGYDIPSRHTGEAWAISAHKNGPSKILNGPLAGYHLRDVWKNHPSLFGKTSTEEEFPLLVKILDANDHLSVQVHPDDPYARNVEGEPYGKTECWYILDCDDDAEIVFGHHARSKEGFQAMAAAGEWDRLLRRVNVQKGDFIYVPSGTLHAIGKGIVILETQQSSDITYRVYDYDRRDAKGRTRELHLQSSVEVMNYPHDAGQPDKVENVIGDLVSTRLIKEEYFTVYHWQLDGQAVTPLRNDYLLASVIAGEGHITVCEHDFAIKKGDHFILPATIKHYQLKGDLEMILSHE